MPWSRGTPRWVKLARRLATVLAPLTALLLLIALSGAGAVSPASASVDAPGRHRPPVAADRPVPFKWQVPGKDPVPKRFRHYDPRVDSRLPGPGSATVKVPGAVQGRSAAGLIRAGSLPVSVGETAAATMTVRLVSQPTAQAAGVRGVLFTVGSTRPGQATVAVDDASFAAAFGGDYAARLHLVRMPACALTTPKQPRCQAQAPVRPASPRTPLSAQVTMQPGSAPMVLAATSGPGDYTATSLSPAGTWTSGGNTGSFDYSYPVHVPAAIGGATPNVDLSYDSSSQDGRTEGTNNQSSWIGDGWTSAENYIERSYESCSDDSSSGAPAGSGDLCMKGQVLTLSLNGQSTPIVYDGSTFRPADDSATIKIDQLTNCPNHTYNNECWRVTENGTQYYFGLNQLPGWSSGKAETQSAWTVPVYCLKPGVSCSKGDTSAFASSVETTAGWRWNLDYVVDPHGNAMAYYYAPESNNYGADMQATPVKYTRGGYLSRIDYGMTASTIYSGTAPEQIVFNVGQRCGLPGTPSVASDSTCTDANFTVTHASWWPDVPIDQDCAVNNTGSCPNHAPTFWSRARLKSVIMQVQVNGATQPADEYDFTQAFPDGGDHAPTLWLDSITHTGLDTSAGASGTVAVSAISFDPPLQLPNRVGVLPDEPAMYHDRIKAITTETGAQITVTYNTPACTPTSIPADPSKNTGDCFPAYWTPYQATSPKLDWFNKYTVKSVLTQDTHNPNPDGSFPKQLITYRYAPNGAGWHYDDNELVKPGNRTYGQFRGYAWVETITGDPTAFHVRAGSNVHDQQSLTKTSYFQGMSNDTPTGTGGAAVTLTSSDGAYQATDANALAGLPFETDTYTDATGTTLQSATVNVPVIIGPTATRTRTGLPPLTAQMVRTARSYAKTVVSSGPGWRSTETDNFYNTTLGQPTTGLLVQSDDRGQVADPANVARCTWTRYLTNADAAMALPAEVITNAQDCTAAGAAPAGKLISDTRTSYDGNAFTYDGASPAGTPPTLGDVTAAATASASADGKTASAFVTTSTTTYDAYGRPAVVTRTPNSTAPDGSSLAQATTTSYSPASGALPTQVQTKVQVTAGSSPTYQTSTVKLDPARDLPVEEKDIAGHLTELTYDALGRRTAVWLPNKSKADPANYTYSYILSQAGPSVVATHTLTDDPSNAVYTTSETLYDALLRPRQTQATGENSHIVVTDTQYNSLGAVVATSPNYSVSGSPGSTLVTNVPQGSVPETIVTDYDALGRPDLVTTEHDGAATSATVTAYAGDHTTVIPPSGGVTQTTYTNARGQTTELDQYTSPPTVTGTPQAGYAATGGSFQKTTYAYTPAGQQASVTGPDNTIHTSAYDLTGRLVQQVDPDAGTSTSGYDDAGDLVSTTDARGIQLGYTYDLLGRKLTAIDKSNNNFTFATWAYDTLQPGQLTSSTRYVPGVTGGYTVAATGYTSLGKPTGATITLPASEAPLPTTYTTGFGYTGNDQLLNSQADPQVAGLRGETITYQADVLGNPSTTASSLGTYVGGITYDPLGNPNLVTLGDSANPARLTYTYDDQTERLLSVKADRTQAPGPTVDLTSYTYNQTGDLTSVTDQQSETGSTATDTQCYGYDPLDRLTQAWTDTAGVTPAGPAGVGGCKTSTPSNSTLATGATAYWQSFGYDAAGDRLSETDHAVNGAAKDTATTYTNGGTPSSACASNVVQPHALTQTSVAGPSGTAATAFCYDAQGDMVARSPSTGTGQKLTWDDQGELASISQGSSTTSYVYDADGNQLIRRDPGRTTLFAGDTEIVVNTAVTPNVVLGGVRSYTSGGGGTPIAVRSTLPGGGLDYLLSDPHGTATLAMDATTQAVTRQQHTPYGQLRGGASPSWPDPTRGYLGKPVDATTGYTDLGARKYDPALGRFISVDPLLENDSPQELGGYTYAADNPIGGSDPTGQACASLDGSRCDYKPPAGGGGGGTGGGSPAPPTTCHPGTPGCQGPVYHSPPPATGGGGHGDGSSGSANGGLPGSCPIGTTGCPQGPVYHAPVSPPAPPLGASAPHSVRDCLSDPTQWNCLTLGTVAAVSGGRFSVTVRIARGIASVIMALHGATHDPHSNQPFDESLPRPPRTTRTPNPDQGGGKAPGPAKGGPPDGEGGGPGDGSPGDGRGPADIPGYREPGGGEVPGGGGGDFLLGKLRELD